MGSGAAPWYADRLDELLRRLSHQAARAAGPDPREVVDWLHRQVGADVALIGRSGGVEHATGGFPRALLDPLGPVLARLSDGRLDSAATEADGIPVRLEALGPRAPRPVLAVAGYTGLSREEASVAAHTGGVIAILDRAREADARYREYHDAAHGIRLALYMTLMAGDPLLARRVVSGAVPPLLDLERARVLLLRCAQDRDRLSRALHDRVGHYGLDLLVRCPVYPDHLVCLVGEDGGIRSGGTRPGRPDLQEVLRGLVRDHPRYALGISGPHPLRATAEAYEQARNALAAANQTPSRWAGYPAQVVLERVLPRAAARRWARALLRPAHASPQLTLTITNLALQFPKSAVARLLGISRNTVAAHLKTARDALGLDLDEPRARAAVALALSISPPVPGAEPPPPDPSAPSLADLLRCEEATTWAAAFLRPLHRDARGRDLLGTLATWIACGTDAQRAAQRLGSSRATVRARLRAAETLLHRDLLWHGAGVHDLVHALLITGGLPVGPDPGPGSRS